MRIRFLLAMIIGVAAQYASAEKTNVSHTILDADDWSVGWTLTLKPTEGFEGEYNSDVLSISEYLGNSSSVEIPSGFWVETSYRIDYSGPYLVETNYFPATLGWHVFSGKAVRSVNLGSHSKIPLGCFSGCSSLTKVIGTISEIEDSAFENCTSLTSFPFCNLTNSVCNLTNSVINLSKLGKFAFKGCTALKRCDIGGSAEIPPGTFEGCSSLEEVNLSGSTYFDGWRIPGNFRDDYRPPFAGCSNLSKVTLGSGFTKIPEDTFRDLPLLTNVTVTTSLGRIGNNAFNGCTSLRSVIGSEGVNFVDSSAFKNCTSLESVSFGAVDIGIQAFNGCTQLGEVSVNGHSTISNNAFEGCIALESFKGFQSVASIGDNAFNGCGALSGDLDLSKLEHLGDSGFMDCASLTSVAIGRLTKIGSCAFEGCTELKECVIDGDGATIGDNVFAECISLERIKVQGHVRLADSYYKGYGGDKRPFRGCDKLREVELGMGVEKIPNITFSELPSLKTVKATTSLKSIDYDAFLYCSSLEVFEGFSSVRNIGDNAFNGCSSLARSLELSNVETIGVNAFIGCTSLTSVVFGKLSKLGDSAFSGCSGLSSCVIGGQNVTIGNSSFRDCKNLQNVTGWDSVTVIQNSAFNGCSSWTDSLKLNNAEIIGSGAFEGCSSLTSVKIGNKVKSLDRNAFAKCSSLKEVGVEGDGNCVIYDRAFTECNGLEICVFGEGVRTLSYDDRNLGSWQTYSPFHGSPNLKRVEFKNISTLPSYLLENKGKLETVWMPKTTMIKDNVFAGCSALANVSSLASVTNIGRWAFRGCASVTGTVDLSSAEIISEGAFKDCVNITGKVELVKLKTVESGIFSGCERIRQVKFGKDLEVVRADAFSGSTNLIAFTFEGLPPEADDNAFRNVKMGALGIYPGSTLQLDDSENLLRSAQPLSETSDVKKWNDVIAEDGTWQELLMQVNKPVLTNDLYNVEKGSLRLNWKSEKTPEVDKLKKHCITFEIRRGFSDDYKSAEVLTNGYDQLTYTDTQFDSTGDVSRISSIWYWVKPEHPEVKEGDKGLQHSNACRTRNRYMLNVGINNYKNNREKSLKFCVSDAQGWANKLNYTSYKNEPYLSDGLATKENICKGLKDLSNKVTPGDLFVYTHSSHGNQNLLCCYDKNLTAAEFGNELRQFSKYTRIVVIIDACKSGSIPSGMDARAMLMQSTSRAEERTFVDSVIEYMDSPRMGMLSNGTGDSTTISSSSEIGWLTAVSANELAEDGVYSRKCLQSAGWENSGADHDDDGWITFEDLGVFSQYWLGRMYYRYQMTPQVINPDRLKALAGKVESKKYKNLGTPLIKTIEGNLPPYTIGIEVENGENATIYEVHVRNANGVDKSINYRSHLIGITQNHVPISLEPYEVSVRTFNPMDVSLESNILVCRMKESESINEAIRIINESRPNGTPSIVSEDGSNDYESLNQDHDGDGRTTFQEVYAGSDPFDATSQFTANITMENGKPKVTPVPDLGEARKYTIYGKTDLGNPAANWTDMSSVPEEEKPEYRFFKVGVSLP